METLTAPEAPSVSAPPATGQALLFSTDIEIPDGWEVTVRYTGQQALRLRPDLKERVIEMRAAGAGWLKIGKWLHCHHCVASAIGAMFPENIDIERAKRVARLRSAGDKLVELIDDEPSSVPANMRALAASQLYDKAELLDGRATQRIEHTERVDIFADWENVVGALLDPAQPIEKVLEGAAVREIEAPAPGIGLGGGNDLAIGEAGADPAAVPAPADRSDQAGAGQADRGGARIDAESAVSSGDPTAQSIEPTTSATVPATEPVEATTSRGESPDARNDGGAGVSSAEGGAICPIHSKDQKFSDNGLSSSAP